MKILNFGSMNLDRVYEVEKFVESKETIRADTYHQYLGGKGFNQSIALSNAGCEVYHAGIVGKDGDNIILSLKRNNINVDYIDVIDSESGHAIIQINNGENCIIVFGGANHLINKKMVDRVLDCFEANDLLVIQNEISCIEYLMLKAHQKEMKIVFNPSPFYEKILNYPLNLVDMFFLNEKEIQCLIHSKSNDYKKIIQEFALAYPLSEIILTVGKDGSYYKKDNLLFYQAAFLTDVVDTTAAGDTYEGFFLAAQIRNYSIQQSMMIASKASSLAIQKQGASNSIPTWDEVMEALFDK